MKNKHHSKAPFTIAYVPSTNGRRIDIAIVSFDPNRPSFNLKRRRQESLKDFKNRVVKHTLGGMHL